MVAARVTVLVVVHFDAAEAGAFPSLAPTTPSLGDALFGLRSLLPLLPLPLLLGVLFGARRDGEFGLSGGC